MRYRQIAALLIAAAAAGASSLRVTSVSGDTLWSADTITIAQTVKIAAEDTVQIAAGAVVVTPSRTFDEPILLEGTLIVNGTKEKPVIWDLAADSVGTAILLTKGGSAVFNNVTVKNQNLDAADKGLFTLEDTAQFTVNSCSFTKNETIFNLNDKARLTLKNSIFKENKVESGCINSSSGDSVEILADSCLFENNLASKDGAVFDFGMMDENTKLSVFSSQFKNNRTYGLGGVIHSESDSSLIQFKECIFDTNSASSSGGVVYAKSRGIRLEIDNCRFVGNYAGDRKNQGGGPGVIALSSLGGGAADITNSIFHGNSSGYGTAALMLETDSVTVIQTQITQNSVAPVPGLVGAGLFISWAKKILVDHCTIAGNKSGVGAGIYLQEIQKGDNRVVNTIIADNISDFGSQVVIEKTNNTVFDNCYISNGNKNIYYYNAYAKTGDFTGILNSGALFADDGSESYSLAEGSPCINRAVAIPGIVLPANDLSGKTARIVGDKADIGAYEHPAGTALQFRTSPRPQLAISAANPAEITVRNIRGQTVWRTFLTEEILNPASLIPENQAPGVYFVQFKTASALKLLKIVK